MPEKARRRLAARSGGRQVAADLEARHRLVGGDERLLEDAFHPQPPVVVVRVVVAVAEVPHAAHVAEHPGGDGRRIPDDDLVALPGRGAERGADEGVDALQVGPARLGAGQDQRQRDVLVVRVQQDAEQEQDLLGRTHAAREK